MDRINRSFFCLCDGCNFLMISNKIKLAMNGTDRFKFWYEPQDSPVWADLHILEANQDFLLSASNIPDALGHGYKSTMELYQLYIGEKTSNVDPFLEQILEHGKKQEPNALKDWLSKHPMFGGIQPGFLYSKQYS